MLKHPKPRKRGLVRTLLGRPYNASKKLFRDKVPATNPPIIRKKTIPGLGITTPSSPPANIGFERDLNPDGYTKTRFKNGKLVSTDHFDSNDKLLKSVPAGKYIKAN